MSRIEVEIRDYYVSGAERTVGQLDIKDSDEFPMSITINMPLLCQNSYF